MSQWWRLATGSAATESLVQFSETQMPTLDWIGKNAVVNLHREVPSRQLLCDESLSVGNESDGNLLVEGDNLAALKALLPQYAGKVKCVYIDPPYNTGHEGWAYNDNVNSPEIRRWIKAVVGKEGDDLSRHDKWLCMMYPRLALLREFLTPDGVIFVSIDDNELHHLLNIMDELYGPERRVAVLTWVRKKKGSNLSKEFRKVTEYVVVYKRGDAKIELFGRPAYAEKQVPLLNRTNPTSTLHFPASSMRVGRSMVDGRLGPTDGGEGELRVSLKSTVEIRGGVVRNPFEIVGRWRWSQSTVDEELREGSVFTLSKDLRINVARHNQADKSKALSSLLSPEDGFGTNEDATEELRRMFPECAELPFDFPKPVSLVTALVRAATKHDKAAIVLDSFAGSGTTGHAVLNQNQADGGSRRFILVEMDEAICGNVTARRLERAISGYAENPGLGGGFRYCRLGEVLAEKHAAEQTTSAAASSR